MERLGQLLQRCRQGHDDAVATLVSRFRDYGLALATALLDDHHLAEDAVQEAFLTALDRLDDLRDPVAFPGWFRQIVRTQCNRIARRHCEATPRDVSQTAGATARPIEGLLRKELRATVRRALEDLPDAQRETAELFYLDGRPCDDVARLLNAPAGTVKRRLHDARQRLRSMLLGYVGPEKPTAQPPAGRGLPL